MLTRLVLSVTDIGGYVCSIHLLGGYLQSCFVAPVGVALFLGGISG